MVGDLRTISPSFVVSGPSGVAVRTRLRVTEAEERVLGEVGALLGSLASRDLAARCRDGLSHDKDRWAARKREVTAFSSSRWAGSITKASHDQWGLARRGQVAHLKSLDAAIAMVSHRLSVPVGEKGTGRVPGGYRSKQEWHAKSRRLAVLKDRRAKVAADAAAGRVHVVRARRGGSRDRRRRPRVHQQMGRPALAEADQHHHQEDFPARRGCDRDRAARPGLRSPASDVTAPTPPERWCRASERPDRTPALWP